jgi:hypothetical protein
MLQESNPMHECDRFFIIFFLSLYILLFLSLSPFCLPPLPCLVCIPYGMTWVHCECSIPLCLKKMSNFFHLCSWKFCLLSCFFDIMFVCLFVILSNFTINLMLVLLFCFVFENCSGDLSIFFSCFEVSFREKKDLQNHIPFFLPHDASVYQTQI